MKAVFKRDFLSYFRSAVGYFFVSIFLVLSGTVFYSYNIQNLSGDLLTFLSQLTLLVMLLCPMLTMRMICEDRQKKTDFLLFTSPVSLTGVVIGKYLAAGCIMLITIGLTNIFTLIIATQGGQIYFGEWLVGYLGFTLQSLSFLAVDFLVSCFAKTQIIGAVFAFAANFVLWMLDLLTSSISASWIRNAMNFISLYNRYEAFRIGNLSPSGIFFFLSLIAFCLFLSIKVLDAKRFSQKGAA